MSEEVNGGVDLSSLGSFDFTPAWAKKEAKVSVGKFHSDQGGKGDDSADGSADRRQFGDRKSFGDRKPFGGRDRKPFDRDDRKSFGDRDRKPFGDRSDRGDRKSFGDRKPFGDRDRKPFGGRDAGRGPRPQAERPRPLDVDVKVLPETKALGTIIRKLQNDIHAYKLKDLAFFFLDNPSSILLKITPRAAQPNQPHQRFFQCKACGFASTREEEVADHAVAAHLCDYYDAKEIDTEPPKGNFNCVARCGLSGVLLGPPNIHEFNSVVSEMIRTKFPQMTEEQYRSHIEMVRDPEVIEQWRKGAVKKTVFFAKGQADVEGAAQLIREQAEGEFRRMFLPSLMTTPKHLMMTADMALNSPVKPLVWAVNDALAAERRAPYGMCFALRGAFHHRKLHFFRVNDAHGPEFVTNVEHKEFDTAHAIPELAEAATFLMENPCLDKSEFPDTTDFEKRLKWLVSTGHAIAFTNGVYSMVEKFPKYGPQWKKRAKKPAAKEPAPAPASEPTPAAESAPAPEPAPAAEAPVPVPEPAPVVEAPEAEVPAVAVEPEPAAAPEVSEAPVKEEPKDEAPAQLA